MCTGNHDRNYSGFYIFLSDLLSDSGCAIRAPDVISNQGDTASSQVNVFDAHNHDHTDFIDLPAYGKHMSRLQPSEETDRQNRGRWDIHLPKRIRFPSSVHLGDSLSDRPEIERPPNFVQRKLRHLCIKSATTPEEIYNIAGKSIGKPSLIVPEFRAGCRPSDVSSQIEPEISPPHMISKS